MEIINRMLGAASLGLLALLVGIVFSAVILAIKAVIKYTDKPISMAISNQRLQFHFQVALILFISFMVITLFYILTLPGLKLNSLWP